MPLGRSFLLLKKKKRKSKTNRQNPKLPLPSLQIWITHWNPATEGRFWGASQILPKCGAEPVSGLPVDQIDQLTGSVDIRGC